MAKTRKLRVFLCHASQDKPVVRDLYNRLMREGWIDPWFDEEKLALGQHWASMIEDALDMADAVIIFLSHNSVQKEGFVQRELNYAWEIFLEKPHDVIFLIPFRLDNCEVPRYLRSRQWGDYFGEEKEHTYQTLLRSLKTRHEQKLRLEQTEHANMGEAESYKGSEEKEQLPSNKNRKEIETNSLKPEKVSFTSDYRQIPVSTPIKRAGLLPIFASVSVLFFCLLCVVAWYIDTNFLWCTFFPFISGCY